MPKKLTQEQIIAQFQKVWGNLYDYSLVQYFGNNIKVDIICEKHGTFDITPHDFKSGHGCKKCGIESYKRMKTYSQKEIIEQFKKVHGDTYNFSKVVYQGDAIPVVVICPKHGEFLSVPNRLKQGGGCWDCGNERVSNKLRMTLEEFIKRSKESHGDKYDYSLVEYTNNSTLVNIRCKKHNFVFRQTPSSHIHQMSRCPICSTGSFDPTKEAFLYYIKIGSLYKIGVTTRSVKLRFQSWERKLFDGIITIKAQGHIVYGIEQSILKGSKEYLYKGDSVLASGNTELFTKDVLEWF